jgi:hypothetical protein
MESRTLRFRLCLIQRIVSRGAFSGRNDTMLPSHLFVSSCDGALYDTRVPGWPSRPPLRAHYEGSRKLIKTVADVKAALRYGPYAWPGGYPLYFLTDDGEALSFAAVRDEFRQIAQVIQDHDNSGWRVVGCDINYEDQDLYCAHSGAQIEAAYGKE